MNMTQEEFLEWIETPATRQLLAAFKTEAASLRGIWTARAWGMGLMTPEEQMTLHSYKIESETFERLSKMTYGDFLQWNEKD